MKKRVHTYKQSVVNAVVLVAVILLFVYVLYQIPGGFSTKVSTQRTQKVTESEYTYFDGYVFRNESVLTVDGVAIVDRLVADGERLGVGKHFANVYSTDMGADGADELQGELDALSAGIELLGAQIESGQYVSDLAHINEDLIKYYYSYAEAVADGDITSADRYGSELLDAIVAYRVVTGRDGRAEDISLQLKGERDGLIASLSSAPETMVADEGCHYFYGYDGYESVFSADKLEGLTPAALSSLISAQPESYGGTVIGRIVHDPKWYLCLPCDPSELMLFEVGVSYDVIVSDGDGRAIQMLLEDAVSDDGGAYLLLSCHDMSRSAGASRSRSVRILTDSTTGYRVPAQAIHLRRGEYGVYVLVGSIAEFRRVTIIGEGDGYYIVNTGEMDAAEGGKSDTPYLSVNDLIITSGNDLFDGKHFD